MTRERRVRVRLESVRVGSKARLPARSFPPAAPETSRPPSREDTGITERRRFERAPLSIIFRGCLSVATSLAGVSISSSLARFVAGSSTNFTSATEVSRAVLGIALDRLLSNLRGNSGVSDARKRAGSAAKVATAVDRGVRVFAGTVARARTGGEGEACG